MQRTLSAGIANMVASCLRRLWVACEADQEVSLRSLNSATAQDGPIEPWVWIAKSYVAFSVLAPAWPIASAVLPTLIVTSSLTTLVARTSSHSFATSGSVCDFDHDALSFSAALIAPHSLCATTPRKLPWRTTLTTPATSLIEASSTLSSVAPIAGGRRAHAACRPRGSPACRRNVPSLCPGCRRAAPACPRACSPWGPCRRRAWCDRA